MIMEVALENLRIGEGINERLMPLKQLLEEKLNLSRQVANGEKINSVVNTKIQRMALIAGLAIPEQRTIGDLDKFPISKVGTRFYPSFFTKDGCLPTFSALLKLRYKDCDVNWQEPALVSKIIHKEMVKGAEYLLQDGNLDSYLFAVNEGRGRGGNDIPLLNLVIGEYGEDMEASLNINGRDVSNSQILIAGTTGSGKTNLLAVLIQQMRSLSTDTPYPVNFLLFDYKGEFSDPVNNSWLGLFDVDRSCILDPVSDPLPFSPFKDFSGKTINEVNLYSTEMANALCAIDNAKISANMGNRLSDAIVEAYKKNRLAPITFQMMLEEYKARMTNPDKDDSISSVLSQLVRNNIFADRDSVNLVNECFIVKMDKFPKDGTLAMAIVYFTISKLNNIYEDLPVQAKNEEVVQIRHFTIIDEAHYMLDFDNHPLRNLIAVGRNKGLSIILATQNMDSFKSKHFDFYANAQYPLIMKQQSINDGFIKDFFGVTGKEFAEIKNAISSLGKGELIIKDNMMALLGLGGKNFKKIKVSHLI